jgi:murein DD-endopeptidase MepM/ murein hydrolase activator NlpD
MILWRRSAVGLRLVAISLIGLGAASCSDYDRFDSVNATTPRSDLTGSVPRAPAAAPAGHIDSQPLPHLSSNDEGSSGGGRGMGSYQPAGADITGSLRSAQPQPTWTWEGGTPITVGPGETLESIAHQHGVPLPAMMQANNISNPASVRPGQRLVIPRYRSPSPTLAYVPPATHVGATSTLPPSGPVAAPRTALAAPSTTHTVAPGETLRSIARLYGKPVMVIAHANNIPADFMVRVGQRLVIPDVRPGQVATTAPPRIQAPAAEPAPTRGPNVATIESPHSARVATPEPAPAADNTVKTAEPAGGLPSFRWPVRGRVIAAFGPKPNGLQNDGINVAVPEGTPVKAAEDGVVAYAGNELKGYGNLVLVRHANGFVTAYAHASDILVKRGQSVKRGEVIAHSGQTGNVTSPQLHFEIRKGATPVDPAQYLNGA